MIQMSTNVICIYLIVVKEYKSKYYIGIGL